MPPAPPLEMYTPPPSPAVADAWHQTTAPGGHEAWRLTFSDPATGTHLVATLSTGCPFHPGYLAQYARYRRNPTSVPPPLPPQWPYAHLAVFRDKTLYAESLTLFPAKHFLASTSSLDVTLGLNRLVRTPDSLHLSFRGRPLTRSRLGRPRHPKGGLLHLDLTLYTISPPLPLQHYADHHLAAPVATPCTAKGQLQFRPDGASQPQTFPLTGRACLDHEISTRPLADSFSAHAAGVAFLPHSVLPLRVACTRRPAESLACVFDDDGRLHTLPPARTGWTHAKRPHPTHVDASPLVRLDSPEPLPSHGPLTHLLYRATTPDNQTGHAIVQLLHPDRVPNAAARMFMSPKLPTTEDVKT